MQETKPDEKEIIQKNAFEILSSYRDQIIDKQSITGTLYILTENFYLELILEKNVIREPSKLEQFTDGIETLIQKALADDNFLALVPIMDKPKRLLYQNRYLEKVGVVYGFNNEHYLVFRRTK